MDSGRKSHHEDDNSFSMKTTSSATGGEWTPLADFAAMRRQASITTTVMAILFFFLVGSLLGVVIWSGSLQNVVKNLLASSADNQAATLAMTKKICDVDTNYLFNEHCSAVQTLDRQKLCFLMIARVEELIHMRSKQSIFAALDALEPQTGPINYWGVDEDTLNEDSHLDTFTNGIVSLFNNTAYYHAQKAHMESVPCGGWSLSYWRGFNGTVDLDLVYCEHVSPATGESSEETSKGVRVCGAFKLSSFIV